MATKKKTKSADQLMFEQAYIRGWNMALNIEGIEPDDPQRFAETAWNRFRTDRAANEKKKTSDGHMEYPPGHPLAYRNTLPMDFTKENE
jgi:hypothetical protein